jgi:hypothetical protein
MLKSKTKPIRLRNILSNEIWICEDYSNIKLVDGVEFIEVHRENNPRKFWMNKTTLIKIKQNKF